MSAGPEPGAAEPGRGQGRGPAERGRGPAADPAPVYSPERGPEPGRAPEAEGFRRDGDLREQDPAGEVYPNERSAREDGYPAGDGAQRFERLAWQTVPLRVLKLLALVAGAFLLASVPGLLGTREQPEPQGLPGGAGLPLGIIVIVVGTVVAYLSWRATRFRIAPERFELRFDLVVRRHRSLTRERIRTVDVTASPLHRLFGLARVVIGTGQQSSGEASITLDAVTAARADALREQLLAQPSSTPASSPHEPPSSRLASLDWRWIGYAPLSVLTLALGAAAVGGVVNLATTLGRTEGVFNYVLEVFVRGSVLGAYLVLVLAALVIGVVAALVLFTEMWWAYRLDREAGPTLRVRRGLLTTRSVSIEERRLRGVELVEPLGIRLAGAARLDAVATGIAAGGGRTEHKTLLPSAPRELGGRVATAVLAEGSSPVDPGGLRAHPRAALGRRLRWALAPVAALLAVSVTTAVAAAATGAAELRAWAGAGVVVSLLVLAPVAVLLARDAYGNLGHTLRGRYLLARSGALRRSTVALQRSGVIGWTVRQSIFQRRAGLVTLVATTAAGAGAYAVPDVDEREGLAFAEQAVPGLLTPFLERDPGISDPGSSDPGSNDPGSNDPGSNDPGSNDPGSSDRGTPL